MASEDKKFTVSPIRLIITDTVRHK